jgi:hypothetical protein
VVIVYGTMQVELFMMRALFSGNNNNNNDKKKKKKLAEQACYAVLATFCVI